VFLPMQLPGDLRLASQMAEGFAAPAVVLAAPATPSDAMAVMAGMDVVVAMRLHALILAGAAGVPCVGLAYDPKVPAFMEAAGQPCLGLDAEPGAVAEAIRSALDRREEEAARIAAAVEPLRRAAARNIELALGLLPSP
jgi:polysaccharide pyruvyl transferase WcaK-like protein